MPKPNEATPVAGVLSEAARDVLVADYKALRSEVNKAQKIVSDLLPKLQATEALLRAHNVDLGSIEV